MPSMRELGGSQGSSDLLGLPSQQSAPNEDSSPAPQPLPHDLSDISFLDPVNPDLVAMTNHLEHQLRIGGGVGGGSAAVLPGPLCHPMSVEEKVGNNCLQTCPNESDVVNFGLEKQQLQVFLSSFYSTHWFFNFFSSVPNITIQ